VNSILKKWAFAFAAASILIIGCGGGGGGNNGSSGGSGGNGNGGSGGGPVVNLGSAPGYVSFQYLSGAGRAPGDMTVVIKNLQLQSPNTGQIFETVISPELDVQLNGYTLNSQRLAIPGVVNSVTFDQYLLELDSLKIEGGGTYSGSNGSPLVYEQFPAHITVFPGRQSNVAVRLDDTMFTLGAGGVTFHDDYFLAVNTSASTGDVVNSYLADYLMFDISGLTGTHPVLPQDGTTPADRVYFTGDNYAVSSAAAGGEFDVLTPIGFIEGSWQAPISSGRNSFPGTFTLVQPDPRDPDPNTALRITALQGIWRDVNDVVSNLGTFAAISLPSSQDDNFQTILLIKRTGTTITGMYFGQIDLQAGQLRAYPIDQVSPGSTLNEIDGTVSALKDKSGALTADIKSVRSGTFTLVDGTGTVPADFPTTGTFVVFRR